MRTSLGCVRNWSRIRVARGISSPYTAWAIAFCREAPMTLTAPQDAAKINVHEKYELEYWTKKFGVTAAVA